jgi:Flp pilus assembly protein TadG
MPTLIQRTAHRARGQSVVELSIAMPLLLLLLLGTIDVGRVFAEYIQMRNASVEAATYGARRPFDGAGIASAAANHGMPTGASISSSTTGSCGVPRGEGTIVVTASKTYTPRSPGRGRRFPGASTSTRAPACAVLPRPFEPKRLPSLPATEENRR